MNRLLKRYLRDDKYKDTLEKLNKNNINTLEELISSSSSTFELVQRCDIPPEMVNEILRMIGAKIISPPKTAFELLQAEETTRHLSTMNKDVDEQLCGGIRCSSITEICGPNGIGKTQFCLLMSVIASLPIEKGGLGGSVCYIDTGKFF